MLEYGPLYGCKCLLLQTVNVMPHIQYMPSHHDTNIPSILSLQLTIDTYCVTFCHAVFSICQTVTAASTQPPMSV